MANPLQEQGSASGSASGNAKERLVIIKISDALKLESSDEIVNVKGAVSFAGGPEEKEGWLSITDTTDTIYAWGPRFEGNGTLSGKLGIYQGRKYLQVERIRKQKKESLLLKILPFVFLVAIPIVLYFGVSTTFPDFHIADIIGPKEPYPGLSDLKRDKLTSYNLEAIWHEGNILCAELRNTGKMVIPKEDLDRITFSVDNSSIYWNRSTLPEKLMIWKRLPICLCVEVGDGCPEGQVFFKFEKVGGNYPTVEIEIRPWFGEVKTG